MTYTPPVNWGDHEVRVVHLAGFESVYPGSFVSALTETRRAVEARGWSFEAVLGPLAAERDWYRELDDGGMSVQAVDNAPLQARVRWVRRLLAGDPRPTILHTHFAYWDIAAIAGTLGRRTPVGVVWHRHGRVPEGTQAKLRQTSRFLLCRAALDAHLCVGLGQYAEVNRRLSPPDRTYFVPNAIDLDSFTPIGCGERVRARQVLEIAADAKVLVTFVHDWDRKGGDLLLEAILSLARRCPDRKLALLLVGGGMTAEAAIARHGCAELAQVVAPRADIRTLYAVADVFVTAARSEGGVPFAVLEALMCGTPVVASEILDHLPAGDSMPGCRLAQLSPEAFAGAIEEEFRTSSPIRDARLAASRVQIEAAADPELWLRRILAVYDRVLERSQRDTVRKC
jgi:glycosyltransferase involved in cell wall biosynthesis